MDSFLSTLKSDDVQSFEQMKHVLSSIEPSEVSDILPDIFSSDPSLIAYTAFYGAKNCFMSLVKEGMLVVNIDNEFRSAIHFACAGGNSSMVNTLIEDFNQFCNIDSLGRTALHYSTEYNQKDIIELIEEYATEHSIAMSSIINKKDIFGITPFHIAVENENQEIVDYFIENGANVNLSDTDGCVALHIAARIGSVPLISDLLQHGAKVNKKSKNGRTIFHFAAFSGSPSIFRYLLSALKEYGDGNININTPDRFGRIPLHYACEQGSASVVEELLRLHSDVSFRDIDMMIPIHFAAIRGNAEAIQLLIKYKSPVYVKDNELRTPLHLACECGSYKAVRLLCRKYKNMVNEETKYGLTPLHSVASSDYDADNPELVQLLLSKGSDINKKNKFGQTPLQCAIENGFLNTIGVLVESGADLNIISNNNSKDNKTYYSPKRSPKSSRSSSAYQSPCSSPNIYRKSPTKVSAGSKDLFKLDDLL